ncbi:hypothetical protein Bca4012_025238 [Brassica carinata]
MSIPLSTVFGIVGDIISFMLCLTPIPTMIRIHNRKSSEGDHSLTSVIALLSATLWIYYSVISMQGKLLVGVNYMSCVIHISYISFYLFYAPKKEKVLTLKLVLIVDVVLFGALFLLTYFLLHGAKRIEVLGYVCVVYAVCSVGFACGTVQMVICRLKKVFKKHETPDTGGDSVVPQRSGGTGAIVNVEIHKCVCFNLSIND